jgi:ribonuclease HI
MELRALIKALRRLPDGFHVLISTDSAYLKRRITEWLPGWISNGWKNAQRHSVANQTLWQALTASVGRMHMVEWSWAKGRSGYLLNE